MRKSLILIISFTAEFLIEQDNVEEIEEVEEVEQVEEAQIALKSLEILKIRTKKQQKPIERRIPEHDQTNYDFDPCGRILYKNHKYYLVNSKGSNSTNRYRCLNYNSTRCPVTILTASKLLFSITNDHNH